MARSPDLGYGWPDSYDPVKKEFISGRAKPFPANGRFIKADCNFIKANGHFIKANGHFIKLKGSATLELG